MPNESTIGSGPRTLPIVVSDEPRQELRRPGDRGYYDGPTPTWRCPFCERTNTRATLEPIRPEGVEDTCVCGAVASDDYQEATR